MFSSSGLRHTVKEPPCNRGNPIPDPGVVKDCGLVFEGLRSGQISMMQALVAARPALRLVPPVMQLHRGIDPMTMGYGATGFTFSSESQLDLDMQASRFRSYSQGRFQPGSGYYGYDDGMYGYDGIYDEHFYDDIPPLYMEQPYPLSNWYSGRRPRRYSTPAYGFGGDDNMFDAEFGMEFGMDPPVDDFHDEYHDPFHFPPYGYAAQFSYSGPPQYGSREYYANRAARRNGQYLGMEYSGNPQYGTRGYLATRAARRSAQFSEMPYSGPPQYGSREYYANRAARRNAQSSGSRRYSPRYNNGARSMQSAASPQYVDRGYTAQHYTPYNNGGYNNDMEFGSESPMPGMENEYDAVMSQGGAQFAGPSSPPPPIDNDRMNRSPGLSRNFYDTPTADFKRPYSGR